MAMNVVIDMLKNGNKASYVYNGEGRKRRAAGFTMAEMLIVIAIIGVLAAVSFIAVQAHQKSMTQLQYDAIAKEIFVAAQNHLTLAKSENYGQASDLNSDKALNLTVDGKLYFGPDGDASADTINDIRYFYSDADNASTALEQILPFGAVELVTGGKYIIRYQPNAARVLDVFYWTNDTKYGIDSIDYATAVDSYAGDDKKGDRAKIGGNGILGWCGGEDVVTTGEYLVAPEVEVINREMLLVKVTDKNMSESKKSLKPLLKLIVEGDISGAKVAILLDSTKATYIKNGDRVEYKNGQFTVVLDDITTSGLHFSELLTKTPDGTLDNGKVFVPGENITIQAVAYSNTVLASIAYSGEWKTNSLFGEVTEDTSGAKPVADQVRISNIRHLENLNDNLSRAVYNNTYYNSTISAVQTADLDWAVFRTEINNIKETGAGTPISVFDKNSGATKNDCFLPVTVSDEYKLVYDGQYEVEIAQTAADGTPAAPKKIKENHSIKGIVVDNTGEASGTATFASGGVFGALKEAGISNLALIDTSVTLASGNAGALAGTLTDATVTNVVAYNTPDFETELAKTDATKTAVSTKASGAAGGLIGSATNCTIQKSAASLIVKSEGGNAGGLIGTTADGSVIGCYAGGHAIDKKNGTGAGAEIIGVTYDTTNYNVTASGVAGGLIGDAGSTEISYSYSTCSATGATVGGLIGTGSGQIQHSYCTGLVKSTAATPVEGAFAGTYTGTPTDNHYFDIINERDEKDDFGNLTGGYTYLYPVSGEETVPGVAAIDDTASTFNDFCGASTEWKPATPYKEQTRLESYYGGKYNLKTVAQLDDGPVKKVNVVEVDTLIGGVTTPADFVATHQGDWPAPEIFVVNTK